MSSGKWLPYWLMQLLQLRYHRRFHQRNIFGNIMFWEMILIQSMDMAALNINISILHCISALSCRHVFSLTSVSLLTFPWEWCMLHGSHYIFLTFCMDNKIEVYHFVNKANLRDLIAATGLVILHKLDLNHRFFSPCDLEIWWMTPKNNRAPLLCYFKLFASFHSRWWIQTGVTVRKRPIWVKFDTF